MKLSSPESCGMLMLVAFALLSGAVMSLAQPVETVVTVEPDVIVQRDLGVTIPARVLSVHDGDTLKVECRVVMDVRLLDCWAPEITGATKESGIKSKLNLQRMAEGKSAVLHVPWNGEIGKMTSLGRVLGKVIVNGKDMSAEQVQSGNAKAAKE